MPLQYASGSGNWSAWRGLPFDASSLLANGWTVGASRTATYQKSSEGMVTVNAGLVAGTVTASTVIATLPSEYRPKADVSYIPCGTNTSIATINILANGNVTVQSAPANAVMSINVSFPSFVI